MNTASFQINKQDFIDALRMINPLASASFREVGLDRWNCEYTSDYWQSIADGIYSLHVSQGGIRNREIPRQEKDNLKCIFKNTFGENFTGEIMVSVLGGKVLAITTNRR
jgi:hypothetical protein